MKVVLHTEASPGLGGQEIRTLDESRWIAERGWRVLLAGQPSSRFIEQARARGVPAVAVRMRGPFDLGAVRTLARLIQNERVSLVHTHSSIDAWVAGTAARWAGVPVVRTRHVSIAIRRGLNPVYRWLADRVITSGEEIRQLVIAAGTRPERVIAIPAGVDLDAFAGPHESAAVLESVGLGRSAGAPAGPIVGSVAMFRGSKGHDHLLDAFARLHARRADARLLLVGDGGRRAWAEGIARDRGIADAVRFAGFRTDVPALLGIMDCFALASTRTEGVPGSLLQAAAAGIPLVASRIGGIPEFVEDGVTGLLVPPEDPAALADAIERVLADPAAAASRARAARKRCEEGFSREISIGRLLTLYDELLAPRR